MDDPAWIPVRPFRYRVRAAEVSAMMHDGTPGQAERLGSWVAASNQGEQVYLEPGNRLLILLPGESAAVWVNPGDYLVRNCRRPAWWRSFDAADFTENFAPQVRELPIFDSGEVA